MSILGISQWLSISSITVLHQLHGLGMMAAHHNGFLSWWSIPVSVSKWEKSHNEPLICGMPQTLIYSRLLTSIGKPWERSSVSLGAAIINMWMTPIVHLDLGQAKCCHQCPISEDCVGPDVETQTCSSLQKQNGCGFLPPSSQI